MAVDIYQKIVQDFGENHRLVQGKLDELDAKTKGLISDRLVRAIIYLSDGSLEKLDLYIELSRTDFRDVLWQAEYDDPSDTKPSRDFNKTFHQLGLIKKA